MGTWDGKEDYEKYALWPASASRFYKLLCVAYTTTTWIINHSRQHNEPPLYGGLVWNVTNAAESKSVVNDTVLEQLIDELKQN